jgi:CheY-like chemotaxis protein
LSPSGYTVDFAEDGQQAMDAVARHRPDVMVLDMTMPRMDDPGHDDAQDGRSGGLQEAA